MKEDSQSLNARIAARVQNLRHARDLSIDALAKKSGVSRSMISVIERAEANPTAVVLDKLAMALGVGLSALFETAEPAEDKGNRDLVRKAAQTAWQDPASGYTRRNLSPPAQAGQLQLIEIVFPPGQTVSYDSHDPAVLQQVWIISGTMEIRDGETRHVLDRGDCLALAGGRPLGFHNPGKQAARYLVAITPHG